MNIVAKEIAFNNDVGGTELLKGRFKVLVEKSWDDYETGRHFRGRLVLKSDIERTRKAGTTGVTEEDYAKYPVESRAALRERDAEAKRNFDPSLVFVSEFDVVGRNKIPEWARDR